MSRAWHTAVGGAEAAIECSLPGNDVACAAAKMRGLRAVAPCLRHLSLLVSPGAASELLADTLREAAGFHLLRCALRSLRTLGRRAPRMRCAARRHAACATGHAACVAQVPAHG